MIPKDLHRAIAVQYIEVPSTVVLELPAFKSKIVN